MGLHRIREYGKIKSAGEFDEKQISPEEIIISNNSFDNIWNYILECQSSDSTIDEAFKLYTKSGKRVIQVKNYVGVIETKNKDVIEILPKIYRLDSDLECKRLFLSMLASLRDTPYKSFQNASLEIKDDFPIIEIFIALFIAEAENLVIKGMKKGYVRENKNSKFIKGRLLFSQNVTKNLIDQSKFYVNQSVYETNIPQNRIIVTAAKKLHLITSSIENRARLGKLTSLLSDIPISTDIALDLDCSKSNDRLFVDYSTILEWSEIFLLNKSFTNFSGKHINQALLFPMEQLFEAFVAQKFKKYSRGYNVNLQHRQFFLVDRHIDSPRFKLVPDIYARSLAEEPESIIVDTKWKLLDQSQSNAKINYRIDIKDMYQLYAYGKKYSKGSLKEPVLFLVYPKTGHFKEPIEPFYYEEKDGAFHLKLYVLPFDLADKQGYQRQVESILSKSF